MKAISFRRMLGAALGAALSGIMLSSAVFAEGEWPSSGQDITNTRNQKQTKISVDNVSTLNFKWAATLGGDVSATPAVEEGAVYVPDWSGLLTKLDSESGAVLWQRSMLEYTGLPGNLARTTPAIHNDLLIFGDQGGRSSFIPGVTGSANLIAVNKNTGDLVWTTQLDPHPSAIVTQSATVYKGVVYVGTASLEELLAAIIPGYPCCSFRGSLSAINAETGEILWRTYTAPAGYAGNAIWGSAPAIDQKRDQVYIATGNNYSSPQEFADCIIAAGDDNDAQRACITPDNYFDAIMALDLDTGAVNWANVVIPFDVWTVSCIADQLGLPEPGSECPDPAGPDFDFGQEPMLMEVKTDDPKAKKFDLVGAGQKSGIFWALDPDTGETLWSTQVSPGGVAGGLQWGSAFDGERIYTSSANSEFKPWQLADGSTTNFGIWSALDPVTGQILWQTANPGLNRAGGPVSTGNGVVYACSLDPSGMMYAMDAATGSIEWSFMSGASCNSGAAISKDSIYWGSGYGAVGLNPFDTSTNIFRAFEIVD